MDWLTWALEVLLHLDRHLAEWAAWLGPWLPALLFAIVFFETGVVVTPFLPGDSLLFAVGALCAIDGSPLSPGPIMAVLWVAAVTGDALNYQIGKAVGPRVFHSERSRLLKREHLDRTYAFYARHGGKTIFLARFVPIVRTFAPFVAGIGRMGYRHFAAWNATGAAVWVGALTLAGYFFGQLQVVKQNFEIVVLAIVALSLVPVAREAWRARRRPAPAS